MYTLSHQKRIIERDIISISLIYLLARLCDPKVRLPGAQLALEETQHTQRQTHIQLRRTRPSSLLGLSLGLLGLLLEPAID
jgi:hypothetical protein